MQHIGLHAAHQRRILLLSLGGWHPVRHRGIARQQVLLHQGIQPLLECFFTLQHLLRITALDQIELRRAGQAQHLAHLTLLRHQSRIAVLQLAHIVLDIAAACGP